MKYLHKKQLLILTISIFSISILFAQEKSQAYLNYIYTYNKLAKTQQKEYGIPASITLAQGLLESGAGLSQFAISSNNHFGIKCHSDWKGPVVYRDDDAKHECFRKYKKVIDSYEDHSKFLKDRPRYAFLFDLPPTDYKDWARGLKKAGYATDPNYANKLIKIIKTYDLHKYDLAENEVSPFHEVDIKYNNPPESTMGSVNAVINHQVEKNNNVKYVISRYGDSYASIADEFNIRTKSILKYNDVSSNSTLEPGTVVYLQKKRNAASKNNLTYKVHEGDSMYKISQKFAIKLVKLYQLNDMTFSQWIRVGQILKLQKTSAK